MAEHHGSLDGCISALRESLRSAFVGCSRVAVKVHFGEVGNRTALKPGHVRPFTELLRELGLEFFLYDTCVAYPGPRGAARSHRLLALAKGWGRLGPVVVDGGFVEAKGEYLSYEVAAPLVEADGVLVVSHFKGHVCSGFGGAVKNLGMGALSKESKRAIHAGGEPVRRGECVGCKACEAACPLRSISVREKPVISKCFGCSNCGSVCPTGYLAPVVSPGFDGLLADGAVVASRLFSRQWYVNVLQNITRLCDCVPAPGGLIAPDCGFVHGPDMVVVDRLSYEVVVSKAGRDVFLAHNLKSGLAHVDAAGRLLSRA